MLFIYALQDSTQELVTKRAIGMTSGHHDSLTPLITMRCHYERFHVAIVRCLLSC
jgi:hypothetical protein